MYKQQLEDFNVGDRVIIKHIGQQKMTITHLWSSWFSANSATLIFQNSASQMVILEDIPLTALSKL